MGEKSEIICKRRGCTLSYLISTGYCVILCPLLSLTVRGADLQQRAICLQLSASNVACLRGVRGFGRNWTWVPPAIPSSPYLWSQDTTKQNIIKGMYQEWHVWYQKLGVWQLPSLRWYRPCGLLHLLQSDLCSSAFWCVWCLVLCVRVCVCNIWIDVKLLSFSSFFPLPFQ